MELIELSYSEISEIEFLLNKACHSPKWDHRLLSQYRQHIDEKIIPMIAERVGLSKDDWRVTCAVWALEFDILTRMID
jgi:hypothetical protein